MDADLAWEIVGSVAGIVGIPTAVMTAVISSRKARADRAGSASAVLPPGLPPATKPATAKVAVVGEIPQEPQCYQRRADLMAALDAPAGPRVVVVRAVTGMRGVGKTQLAAAYARERIAAGGSLVVWVDAETPGGVLGGLTAVAEELDLAVTGDAEAAGRAVRHWLEADGTGCLLVLDNVSDPELVQPYLPVAGAARVLITSNRQSAVALGTAFGVTEFTEKEGMAYLRERTGLADEAGARRLGEELGWLPLALAQAAAVIATQHLGYGEYAERLARVPVGELLAPVVAGQYPRGVAAAVLLSLETVKGHDPSEACAKAMGLVSVLSAAGVPRRLIRAAAISGALRRSRLRRRLLTADASDAALAQLAGASLLTFTGDGSAVIAHRLVARIIREQLAAAGELAAVCQVCPALLQAEADSLRESWHADRSVARDLAGQITSLAETAAACPGDRLAHALLDLRSAAIWLLLSLGDSTTQAVTLAQALVTDEQRLLGPDHPDTLSSLNNLAGAYQEAGRIGEAVALHERTLADRERLLGPDHPRTATSRGNLAVIYYAAGRPTDAIPLLERALADRERIFGPDHPATLGLRNNLAGAYQEAGRIDEAIALHERSLADRERVLGSDHPDTLLSCNNLATAYRAAGRTGEAIHLHERTVADRERVLGPDHPDTLNGRSNLAFAYQDAGLTAEAIRLGNRTVADMERVLGADHPGTRTARDNLAAAREEASRSGGKQLSRPDGNAEAVDRTFTDPGGQP